MRKVTSIGQNEKYCYMGRRGNVSNGKHGKKKTGGWGALDEQGDADEEELGSKDARLQWEKKQETCNMSKIKLL